MKQAYILQPLSELSEFERAKRAVKSKKGIIQITGCVSSQKTHLMYALGGGFKQKVIICADEERAQKIFDEYRFLDRDVYLYPAKDLLFYSADIRGNYIMRRRMAISQAILSGRASAVVMTFDGLMDAVMSAKMFKESEITLKPGDAIDLDMLVKSVASIGYTREEQVEEAGQFAVRGGIFDIYPLTWDMPARVDFWGDEIDSIRSFDPETQRSVEDMKTLTVCPVDDLWAPDAAREEAGAASFLDYFDRENTVLFLDEPVRLMEKGDEIAAEYNTAFKARESRIKDEDPARSETAFKIYSPDEIASKIAGFFAAGFSALDAKCQRLKPRETFHIDAKAVTPYNHSFELMTRDLKEKKRLGYRVIFLSGSKSRGERLAADLPDYGLNSFYSEDETRFPAEGEVMVTYGHAFGGYEYPLIKYAVISETDIFGRVKKKAERKTNDGRKLLDFETLRVGDYVIHVNHGLGVYRGIVKMSPDGVEKDYMKIEYAGGGYLYIPATQLDMIQKYSGSDTAKPALARLGGTEWKKTKARVRRAVDEIAKDLVDLYAARQEKKGFAFSKDTVWQTEFEETFPFEETPDQLSAIEDVKRDMESPAIMDRLICGDVGYGKTEIAIRAAFKAVQDGKQVAYLCPTTILAQQHYNTFTQRMKDFPVRIELLCRFKTEKEQKEVISETKRGLVDIVIGTHRILSSDVGFKDLGLLIIDEEQRFGVRHKEKIKKLKENVDVLTLTATPIPRTLHMSLSGIRDMSVIEEPPVDRMPIQTYVMEYDGETVREAITRELARGGQVYYVYNRVESIAGMAAKIKELVPDAQVAYAHGKMPEGSLENIMLDFINGQIDVLVCTTIIETGLDIPNVNTIIVHDADKFGLAQMYQLRGRVGRSNRAAYAFLLYRRDKVLRETAEMRLTAIKEFSQLGSGIKIAMRDLEIRGAGNLLGSEQHGHMEAVGYDLYCSMLNEAVRRLRGKEIEKDYQTSIDLNVNAFIPSKYITNEYQKLDIYKRIAAISDIDGYEDMRTELLDRFGTIPEPVKTLLSVALLKTKAHGAYVVSVEQKAGAICFAMYDKANVKAEMIPDLIEKYGGSLSFKNVPNPVFICDYQGSHDDGEVLTVVGEVLDDIKQLIE